MSRVTTRVVSRVPKARSQRGKQTPGKGGQGKTPKHRQVEKLRRGAGTPSWASPAPPGTATRPTAAGQTHHHGRSLGRR